MIEPAETYTHAGIEVRIEYQDFDQELCDPRDCDGNLSTFYLYRPGYKLGDEQLEASGLPEIECPNCGGTGDDDSCPRCEGYTEVEPTLAEFAKSKSAIAIAPLFIFEHSLMSISQGAVVFLDEDEGANIDTDTRGRVVGDEAGWDTSFSGFALVTKEAWKECFGDEPLDKEKVIASVRAEVEVYDLYLQGQCFGYRVAPDTPFEDSCWGFLGMDHIKEEANDAAEYAAERIATEAREKAEWAARDVMTCG